VFLSSDAGWGYVYDWIRRRQNQSEENRKRKRKLEKKAKRLTKNRKKGRRRKPRRTVKTVGNVEKRLEEEKKRIRGTK